MLEGGADIRYIQQLLGHANLETTSIYTQVTIRQLIEVHSRCHPSGLVAKRRKNHTMISMTAREVIDYIKTLPPQERSKVVDFVTKELRVKTLEKRVFNQAAKQVFDRHAQLMRKLSQ